jgi:menaquinone-dependent protoporphyrinogen IX oxidase
MGSAIEWIRPPSGAGRRSAVKTLVVFDSKHGATEEVARRIAEGVKGAGGVAVLLDLRVSGAAKASMSGFDAVALGGPTYAGRWSRRASAFAASRETELAGKAFALFAVGNDQEKGAEVAKAALPPALSAKAQSAYFGGRIDFPSLGRFERFVVKAVSGKAESASTLDLEGAKAFGARFA